MGNQTGIETERGDRTRRGRESMKRQIEIENKQGYGEVGREKERETER